LAVSQLQWIANFCGFQSRMFIPQSEKAREGPWGFCTIGSGIGAKKL
jgi:hypothetical protein